MQHSNIRAYSNISRALVGKASRKTQRQDGLLESDKAQTCKKLMKLVQKLLNV